MANETTDLLDEVTAAEVAHTATSMEVRLGIEVANLRGRNATLDALVKRLEAELADLVELRRIEAGAVAANHFYDQRDGYFEGLADGKG